MATHKQKVESLTKRQVRPMGPGAMVAQLIEEQGISQEEAARRLGVSRVHLNRFLNDRVTLTPDMANRIGRFIGNGAAFWLRVQHSREMWDLLHTDAGDYSDVQPLDKAA